MKKIIYLIFFIALFSSCKKTQNSTTKTSASTEKKAIDSLLNVWHKNAADANFEAYFNTMATKGVFIGTDASENWTTSEFKKFSKPYFDKGKAWSFTPIERNIYITANSKMAWFDELLETHMGICRGSGVLYKKDSLWKIKHYVLSLTIPNDNIEEIKKINKEKDALFLEKHKK